MQRRRVIVVTVIVLALLGSAIGVYRHVTQETEIEVTAVIEPNGGVVEVTDPGSPACGVRIEIPKGAVETSSVASISVKSNAPALPDGFNTGVTAVELDVTAELLDAVEIEFPVEYMPASMEGLPCAFFYDEAAGKWRLVLPSDIDYDNMVMKIRTSHLSIWQWGWVTIDILTNGVVAEAIQDALIEVIGEDRWNTLIGSAESLAEDVIDLAEEITTDAACATIEGTKNALSLYQESLYSELQYLYEDPVGLCDSLLVWCDSMSVYFFENIPERVVELFKDVTVTAACEVIAGHTPVLMAAQALTLGLALAYSPCVICYISLSELNPSFWQRLGSYYVATFGVEMAEAALDDLGCYDSEEPSSVQYSLTVSSTSGGSVTTPGEGTFAYDAGTEANLVAAPASGYRFVNWAGDVGTVANVNAASTTVTMNGDYSIMAYFEEAEVVQPQYTAVIARGLAHTVGLKSDGTVVAVGENDHGQCEVSGWTDTVQVAAGYAHTVDLKDDGTVVAVGWNRDGQWRGVADWTDIVQVSAGWHHTVGLKSDGTVVAAGPQGAEDWARGQCDVGGWTDIIQIAAGSYHTVGLRSDGTVVAAGQTYWGQCNVGAWTNIVQVSAGWHHTVGLKSDGTVVAIGDNECGQCNVDDWTDIVQVAAGMYQTVGLNDDGTVVDTVTAYEAKFAEWDLF